MNWPHLLSEFIVGVSGFVVGISLYLAVFGVRHYKGWLGWAWALDRVGIAIRVGLLALLVWGHDTPVDWKSLAYATGLALSLAGSAILAIRRKTP